MHTTQAPNRQKTLVVPASEASESQVPTENATTCNPKALELPMEILTEILSYFLAPLLPKFITYPNDHSFPRMYYHTKTAEPKSLQALSKTCRLWRSMLYSLVWEHVVCAPEDEREINERLICLISVFEKHRRAEASLVRALTIKLPETHFSNITPLKKVVRLLKVLKNLHTLQILPIRQSYSPGSYFPGLINAFRRQTFSNIQAIILPYCTDIILESCNNVRTIITTGPFQTGLLELIEKNCKAVEAIGGEIDWKSAQCIPRVLPGLCSIRLNVCHIDTFGRHLIQVIRSLKPLKDLRSIELLITDPTKIHDNAELDACIEEAKLLLRGQTGKKSLFLSFQDRIYYGWHPIPRQPLSP